MSLIKSSKEDFFPSFTSLWDDFFGKNAWPEMKSVPAVNISEHPDRFEVEVAAPGMKKEDFKVNLEHNVLTLSGEHNMENESKDKKFTRKEFSYSSFQRSFTLPENVNASGIEAKYNDGILKLVLPKKEEVKQNPSKQITVG